MNGKIRDSKFIWNFKKESFRLLKMNNENYTKNDLSHYTRNILTSNVIPIAFRVAVYNIMFQQYIFLAIKKDKEIT